MSQYREIKCSGKAGSKKYLKKAGYARLIISGGEIITGNHQFLLRFNVRKINRYAIFVSYLQQTTTRGTPALLELLIAKF